MRYIAYLERKEIFGNLGAIFQIRYWSLAQPLDLSSNLNIHIHIFIVHSRCLISPNESDFELGLKQNTQSPSTEQLQACVMSYRI